MSVRFSEVTLTAVMPDEALCVHQYITPGHPGKEEVRRGIEFGSFCERNPGAVSVAADIAMYITGHSAEMRNADEDHIKMIGAYEADSGKRFVNRTNVDYLERAAYFYTPPFGEPKGENGGANEY